MICKNCNKTFLKNGNAFCSKCFDNLQNRFNIAEHIYESEEDFS